MKYLILISIVFLFGCENPFNIEGLKKFGGMGSKDTPLTDNYTYFYRTIHVKTTSGDPCPDALATASDESWEADTLGIIISYISTHLSNPPKCMTEHMVVYKDASDTTIFWEGNVTFCKSWSPILVVRFPDSP
jgi:hypothetical protein